ncbi:hypothetical protein [Polyangium aurulentum]|uniref:hypothetical protein n=1 Tax=Polyangium aurulentum TaxID=2567896 RepID=UPI001F292CF3|nr:hypothetical protein [Polyangium aurulentum]
MKSILGPVALLGFAAVAVPACSGDTDGATGGNACVPGQTVSCACAGGAEGVQACKADGTFGTCDCGGGNTGGGGGAGGGGNGGGGGDCNHGEMATCGNGVTDGAEQCDDGNCVNDDACTNACVKAYCGDKIVQMSQGETCDDGQNEVGDMCPDDCGKCAGKLVFTDFFGQQQTSQWAYMGKLGFDAGNEMCKSLGADSVCDYEQLKEVLTNQAGHAADVTKMLTKVPAGGAITVWVNRTTPEMVNGVMSPPGAGGRCNEWVYSTNHISDGEYVTLTNNGGTLTHAFSLDPDTVYTGDPIDGHAGPGLDCGNAQRYIACCFPKCAP